MIDFRTYNIIGGINGLYVTLFDTTTNDDYAANDINIATGIDSGTLVLQDPTSGISYSATLDVETIENSRSPGGVIIHRSSFSPVITTFPDALYSTYYIIKATRSSNPAIIEELPAALSTIFYGTSDIKIKRSIINSAWKSVYSVRSPHYDNSLKIKSWFDNMKIANELGFTSEALRLLNALKKVIA